MDTKFNSLFNMSNKDKISSKYGNNYYINQTDYINLDPRIRESPLILNDYDDKLYQDILDKRQYGNLPVTIISGRPCSTSLCELNNRPCDNGGWTEVINDVPITCENDFSPNASKGNPKRILNNIELEARLFNIDYNVDKCGKKNFKSAKDTSSLNCYKNTLKSDSMNHSPQFYIPNKHNPKNNNQCKKEFYPRFNQSSKRINTVKW